MRNLKILGLSLLALVGVMAVSASAAQAEWLILLNKESVSSVTVDLATERAGHLLVPDLGLDIACVKGEGTVTATLESGNEVLKGSGSILYTECKDNNFGEVCEVGSKGEESGKIKAIGSGIGGMEGEKVFTKLESTENAPFTDIEYRGEECPLTEINGEVTGFVLVEVVSPLVDAKLKLGIVREQDLEYGGQPATLEDDLLNTEPAVSITDDDPNATLALHLVNL